MSPSSLPLSSPSAAWQVRVAIGLIVAAACLPGAARFSDGAAPLVETARMVGLASMLLWALSLLLMLRLKIIEERVGGLDRLYYLHHLCGGMAYLAMLAHPLPLLFAGSPGDLLAILHWPLATGWAALLLMMAMMLATFLLPLAYARWKQVHALSAPAFVLAGAHAIALAPGALSPDRLLAGAALLIGCICLAIRYLMETGRLRSLPYRVEKVTRPTPDITEIVLSPDRLMVRPRAGQFIFAAFFDGTRFHGCGEFHPFTVVSSDPGSGRFSLLVKALGDCTRHLTQVEVGTRARVEGPYGTFLKSMDPARRQLWIAGGIGVTPFVSAAAALPPASEAVDLCYIAASEADAVGLGELRHHAARNGRLAVHALLGARDLAAIRAEIRTLVPDFAKRQIFMCGPPGLVDGLRHALMQAGASAHDIHSERFDFR